MTNKEKFLDIFEKEIHRAGKEQFLNWLERTDFFTAPASTRFHLSEEGGLLKHSLSVYETFLDKHYDENEDNLESVAICTLLHDLCKANYYTIAERNVKNKQTGKWEKQPYYTVEDEFPYGHGEKSVYLIERFMRLRPCEAVAIRWHMGGFDEAVKGGSFAISKAYEKYPFAVKLHLSDMESTYLRESKNE